MMNALLPASIKHINKTGDQMENLTAFQHAMKEFGVPEDEIFHTDDLFEAKNMKQVVDSLATLAKTVSDKQLHKSSYLLLCKFVC